MISLLYKVAIIVLKKEKKKGAKQVAIFQCSLDDETHTYIDKNDDKRSKKSLLLLEKMKCLN